MESALTGFVRVLRNAELAHARKASSDTCSRRSGRFCGNDHNSCTCNSSQCGTYARCDTRCSNEGSDPTF